MLKVKIDMTGWVMSEHGVPDSRLTVLCQSEDQISPHGQHRAMWLCECSCKARNKIVVDGVNLRSGATKSCGCLSIETLKNRHKKESLEKIRQVGSFGTLHPELMDFWDMNIITEEECLNLLKQKE